MNRRIIIWVLLLLPTWLLAQQEIRFTVQLSGGDTIGLHEMVDIKFIIEGTEYKDFQLPEFSGFQTVSGPYQSTSISYVNGVMSRETSYTYRLVAVEKGTFVFEPATILVGGGMLETEAVMVVVIESGLKKPQQLQEKNTKNPIDDPIFKEKFKDTKIYSI